MNNSTKMMFLLTLISGMVITISSNSWIGIWMGLEINLLSFIPLMSNNNNLYSTEASLKYFIIQALASSILLFIILITSMIINIYMIMNYYNFMSIMIYPLMLKMAAPPLHWWFPGIMEGLNWNNCFILMTLQKISPMMVLTYLMENTIEIMMIIMISIVVGSIGGINQTSIRKLLSYSSINHIGWMYAAMLISENMWTIYFMIYVMMILTIITLLKLMSISFINQMSFMTNNPIFIYLFFTSLLSIAGLPPFTGFLSKWIIIQYLINNNMIMISMFMMIMSLITLYYYLRISYYSFLMLNLEPMWFQLFFQQDNMNSFMIIFATMLMIMMPMITIIFL